MATGAVQEQACNEEQRKNWWCRCDQIRRVDTKNRLCDGEAWLFGNSNVDCNVAVVDEV